MAAVLGVDSASGCSSGGNGDGGRVAWVRGLGAVDLAALVEAAEGLDDGAGELGPTRGARRVTVGGKNTVKQRCDKGWRELRGI